VAVIIIEILIQPGDSRRKFLVGFDYFFLPGGVLLGMRKGERQQLTA